MKSFTDEKRTENRVSADKQFVFICGLHRSGTSLLFKGLKEHPMISGFQDTDVPEDEGQHLQTVFLPAKAYGGPGRFGFNTDSYLDEHSSTVSEENANRLFAEWSRYWDLSKPFLVEKSPPNLVRTRYLQALFPNAFFIVMLRHPVAVSYSTQEWIGLEIEMLLEHWLMCYEKFHADRQYLGRVHIIKYEDLVATPATRLNAVFDFSGTRFPFHPNGNILSCERKILHKVEC